MSTRIACFAMSAMQKFRALLQVASELAKAGADVRFWTDLAFRTEVEAAGATFIDLFDPATLDSVDDASYPISSRNVTFAAQRGAPVADVVQDWGANLIVYDSFAVIGEAVARRLGLPRVPVISGHLIDGRIMRQQTAAEQRVVTDARCIAAVATLARDFGMAGASPFSYFAEPSPWLNIACEPQEWVDALSLQRYQPLVEFGKLPPLAFVPRVPRPNGAPLRIYAAFGTVVWWYWGNQVVAALEVIADAAAEIGARLVIGLGGRLLPADIGKRVTEQGAILHEFADQRAELASADIFITHSGASSVHEAIAATVPMLSLPFFADQPALAARCKDFGLAISLIDGSGRDQPLERDRVVAKIKEAVSRRDEMLAALAKAREWELRALQTRPSIARRIIDLAPMG